jgi:hypothetical protein
MEWTRDFSLEDLKSKLTRSRHVWMRGKTPEDQDVHGRLIHIYPGIGFCVVYDSTYYTIINDFEVTTQCPPAPTFAYKPEGPLNPLVKKTLTTRSILFWLWNNVPTKGLLLPLEIVNRELVYSRLEKGLESNLEPAAMLLPEVATRAGLELPAFSQENPVLEPCLLYFLDTGEVMIPGPGDSLTRTVHCRVRETLSNNTRLWHVTRALKFREREGGLSTKGVSRETPCGNYKIVYTFDDDNHKLLVYIRNTHARTELNFEYPLPTHPGSLPASPAQPFVLRSPPVRAASPLGVRAHTPAPIQDLSPIAGIGDNEGSDDDSLPDLLPRISPLNSAMSPSHSGQAYSSWLAALSEKDLLSERARVVAELHNWEGKMDTITDEIDKRDQQKKEEQLAASVKRLSRSDLVEALEETHHQIKMIYRRNAWREKMSDHDRDELTAAENWCMAAYSELRSRR